MTALAVPPPPTAFLRPQLIAPAHYAPEDEQHFVDEIRETMKACGWEFVYHTFNSKRSEPGMLDLYALRRDPRYGPRRELHAECKMRSGRFTYFQWRVACLHTEFPTHEVYGWYPKDLPEIYRIITSVGPPEGESYTSVRVHLDALEMGQKSYLKPTEAQVRAQLLRMGGRARRRS